jgi:hypothetical protein
MTLALGMQLQVNLRNNQRSVLLYVVPSLRAANPGSGEPR